MARADFYLYIRIRGVKTFGPVFLGFNPEVDTGTPLDRRGSPGTSMCTKNQPRVPILRPFRGNFTFWVLGFSHESGVIVPDWVQIAKGSTPCDAVLHNKEVVIPFLEWNGASWEVAPKTQVLKPQTMSPKSHGPYVGSIETFEVYGCLPHIFRSTATRIKQYRFSSAA